MKVQHWRNHNQQRETEVHGEKICITVTNLTQTALEPQPVLHSEKLVTMWSQLHCARWWQHFAMTREGDRLSSMDKWPSWTGACVGPILTAPHNDGQQPRLKQAMNATISEYMTCTGAIAPMWIPVSHLLWAPTEHLPCANHDCLLGFHICSVFGLLHLRGTSQQTKYLGME